MIDPKTQENERGQDNWAPGERADGSIPDVSDFPASLAERDADEAAFANWGDDEEGDPEDISDLDDPIPE